MHLFWITSRAAGTLALLFSSAGVGVGLMMGGKLLKGRGPDLRTAHEALSLRASTWCSGPRWPPPMAATAWSRSR